MRTERKLMSADLQFRLQLLGGFGLRRSTPSGADIVVSSKKARALLAYVAMQEPMRISRERLASLLWPDRVDRQARQNLRKCIASLRRDLGGHADGLLAIDGETFGIRDVVTVDARRLRELADADTIVDLDQAAALCRGPFLCDLATEGEEIRDWALAERVQLDAAAGTILAKLASHADQAGDARKALQASSRLTAIDPFREDWQRLSLRIAARHVGRDQALVQAKSLTALLRKELDVEPEAETAELIEQIRAGDIAQIRAPIRDRGVAIADTISDAPPDRSDHHAAALPKFPVPAHAGGYPMIASALVATVVALLVVYLSAAYGPGGRLESLKPVAAAAIDPSTIPVLVLPFQSETAETTAFAHALTENLLTSMARISSLTVFDGRSTEGVRDRSRPAANESGARFATWGSVRRQGATTRLTVGLSDTTNLRLIWADDITAGDDQIASLDTEIPKRIARDLQVQATYAEAGKLDGTALNLAPMSQLIAKAVTIRFRGVPLDGEPSATALYEEVLRRDRSSAPALIGLAAEHIMSSVSFLNERTPSLAQAEALIDQALQINPRIERSHYWLGNIYLRQGQRALALAEFERALALNPSFLPAEAHAGFSLVLLGHTNDGLSRIDHALTASATDPDARAWLRFAAIAQLELGNDRQAIASLLQAASLSPASPSPLLRAALASAYALTSERAKSQEQFRLLKAAADPTALDQLLKSLSNANPHSLRYWQGLQLAASDPL
jgi:DNA-binding SARP family transcriptional activator/TolB-like protein/Tfp pilus assembly protein PilF